MKKPTWWVRKLASRPMIRHQRMLCLTTPDRMSQSQMPSPVAARACTSRCSDSRKASSISFLAVMSRWVPYMSSGVPSPVQVATFPRSWTQTHWPSLWRIRHSAS